MSESKFSWYINVWKGLKTSLIVAGAQLAIEALGLLTTEIDTGNLKLGFFNSVAAGIIRMGVNYLQEYRKNQ